MENNKFGIGEKLTFHGKGEFLVIDITNDTYHIQVNDPGPLPVHTQTKILKVLNEDTHKIFSKALKNPHGI